MNLRSASHSRVPVPNKITSKFHFLRSTCCLIYLYRYFCAIKFSLFIWNVVTLCAHMYVYDWLMKLRFDEFVREIGAPSSMDSIAYVRSSSCRSLSLWILFNETYILGDVRDLLHVNCIFNLQIYSVKRKEHLFLSFIEPAISYVNKWTIE